jgi:hypothetical protein
MRSCPSPPHVGEGRRSPLSAPVIEGGQVELAEALGVAERVDGNDLAVGDGEAHDRDRLAVDGDDDTGSTVAPDALPGIGMACDSQVRAGP